MQKNGTALAVLKDGSHVTVAGVYDTFADLRAAVKLHTKAVWLEVTDFVYAYGAEVQRYTLSEFRSEFGPPLEGESGEWRVLPQCVNPHNPLRQHGGDYTTASNSEGI